MTNQSSVPQGEPMSLLMLLAESGGMGWGEWPGVMGGSMGNL